MSEPLPRPQPGDATLDVRWVDRWIAGTCTPEEVSAIEAWFDVEPGRRQEIVRVREAAVRVFAYPNVTAPEIVWERLRLRVGEAKQTQRREGLRDERTAASKVLGRHTFWGGISGLGTRPLGRLWTAIPIVGAAIAILLVGWNAGLHHIGEPQPSSFLTYTTAKGQRANITLPDGSAVLLNVASRLDVPANYSAGNHALRLSGEALFVVAHRTHAPFTVTSGDATARVLGTRFLVRHYPDDHAVLIAVHDGKVAVRSTVLAAQQAVDITGRQMSAIRTAQASQFGFAAGTLSLDGMLLPEAIVELDRWYDVDIRLGDPALRTKYVEGEFASGALSDLTAILELALDVHVVRDGRILTLFPK